MNNFEIHVLLRHYWKKGLFARAAAIEICEVEGEGTIGKTAAIKWFKRFEDGDFDFEDKPRSGRPSILDEEDLRAALEDEPSSNTRDLADELGVAQRTVVNYLHKFAQDFLETTGIRCRLDAPIPLPCWHVSGELRHNLFLAFKEAVNNIVKHANATEVHISMELQPAAFSLTVEDNGKGLAAGISPAQFRGRNGFRNMKQRMADVGGLWEVSSVPGQGTKITFVLPKREPEL